MSWCVAGVLSLAALGALAYMDIRHVQREEFRQALHIHQQDRLLDKIEDADAESSRLKLYNRLGSPANKLARDQVIEDTDKRKERWTMQLKLLSEQRAANE